MGKDMEKGRERNLRVEKVFGRTLKGIDIKDLMIWGRDRDLMIIMVVLDQWVIG